MKEAIENGNTLPKNCLFKLHACEEYILHSSINELQQPKVALATAIHEILLYDVESQAKITTFKTHEDKITDVKFSLQDQNILFSGSLDGRILFWDLRKGLQPVLSFSDNSDGPLKPINTFDYNCTEQYVCGGTEVIREDAFLIFWDKRMTKPVGGYWDSHFDEITQVQFHPSIESSLASASVDGLLNLFDLKEAEEEDALDNTLNVESSINRFCWRRDESVSCITSTEEFQFWFTKEVKPAITLSKKQLSEDFMCEVDYLIDTFEVNDSSYLLSGTNEGFTQMYSCEGSGLKIMCELRYGHEDVVRTVSYSKKNNYLVTGGEDGNICIWRSPIS